MSTDLPAGSLFTNGERFGFEAIAQHHRNAASLALALVATGFAALLGAAGVAALEWEIVFRVFAALSGHEEANWSPRLMAFSGVVVIVAFHVLAQHNARHLLVRSVERAVGLLIPVYALGVGFLLAALLYADGLGDVARSNTGFLMESPAAHDVGTGRGVNALFEGTLSPLATLIFAAGVGGIAVCNLFVSHRLLCRAEQSLIQAATRLRRWRRARADMVKIIDAQRCYARLRAHIEALEREWDDAGICDAISQHVLSVIADELAPHKAWLAARSLRKPTRFAREDGIAIDQVAKRVAQIEAITREDVLRALQS